MRGTPRYLISWLSLAAALLAAPAFSAGPSSTACNDVYTRLWNGVSATRPVDELKRSRAVFSEIGSADNQRWIAAANRDAVPGILFVDAENALLKALNDRVFGDKELVTALTNRHKELLLEALRKDPVLAAALKEKYSDFKSLRFAFSGDVASLKPRIAAAYESASRHYSQEVKDLSLEARIAYRDPGTWNLLGMGSTADEAGAALREAREHVANAAPGRPVPVRSFDEALPFLESQLRSAAGTREQIGKLFGGTGLLKKVPGLAGKPVLSAHALEIVRKGAELSPRELASELSAAFRTSVTEREIPLLKEYLAQVDQFVAGIRAAERVVIPVHEARAGLVSIDFAGQNSRNLRATAEAMARMEGKPVREAIRSFRQAERDATRALDRLKARVSSAATSMAAGDSPRVHFSGDDGMFFPKRELDDAEKRRFVQLLGRIGTPSNYRVVFLPQTDAAGVLIPAEARSLHVVAGESLEKTARKKLMSLLGVEQSDRLMISLDLQPQAGGGLATRVLVTGEDSPEIRKAVAKVLGEASRDARIRLQSIEHVAPLDARAPSVPLKFALDIPKRRMEESDRESRRPDRSSAIHRPGPREAGRGLFASA